MLPLAPALLCLCWAAGPLASASPGHPLVESASSLVIVGAFPSASAPSPASPAQLEALDAATLPLRRRLQQQQSPGAAPAALAAAVCARAKELRAAAGSSDARVSVSARTTLLADGAHRRSWAEIASTAHVARYLCHIEALRAVVDSGRDIGLVLLWGEEEDAGSGDGESHWAAFAASLSEGVEGGRVHHATVSTVPHPNLARLLASARWHGDAVSVLGMRDPRFRKWGKGFGVKLELLHAYARSLPANDLLLFTDAFDVLMLASQRDVRRQFLMASRLAMAHSEAESAAAAASTAAAGPGSGPDLRVPSILFSAEHYCHPDPNRSLLYPATDRRHASHSFLNSGTFVGRAGAIAAAMARFPHYTVADDDQRYWTTVYLASRADRSMPRVELDHEGDVFLCMNAYRADGDLDFDPAVRRYKFRAGRGVPLVIHFNGRKDDVAPFFRALGGEAALVAEAAPLAAAMGAVTPARRGPEFWSPYSLGDSPLLLLCLALLAVKALVLGCAAGRALRASVFVVECV